jgi:hypothetical protein
MLQKEREVARLVKNNFRFPMFFKNLDPRPKSVVPPGTDLGKLNVELLHLMIGNLLAFGILSLQQARSHDQPRLGGGSTKVAEHRFEAAQGNPCPILAHLAEQTMFNGIPLGATCGIMRDPRIAQRDVSSE